jgi:PE family
MTSGFGVIPAAVDLSSVTESGIGAEMAATTAAGAAALTGVTPMAADTDSAAFAQALNATGATYLATMADHVEQRTAFAGAQSLASGTYAAMDAIHGTALG